MTRGAVGTCEIGQARYCLRLWRPDETWGLPLAQWWADDPDLLRQQAREGREIAAMQGMSYQLWNNDTGQQLDLAHLR